MQFEKRGQGWAVKLRIGEDRRPWFAIAEPAEAEARRRAEVMEDLARRLVKAKRLGQALTALQALGACTNLDEFEGTASGIAKVCGERRAKKGAPLPVTFQELGEQWTSGKLHKRWPDNFKLKESADDDVSRLTEIYKSIGHIAVADLTLEDIDRALEVLPERVQKAGARKQYKQVIAFLMKRAVHPCRLRKDNPLPDGFTAVIAETTPQYSYLYPDDDRLLLACGDVDIWFRALVGFVVREGGSRVSEPFRLRWLNIDFVRGVIIMGKTKTDCGRSWMLRPDTVRTFKLLRERFAPDAPDDALVFPPISISHAAKMLRTALRVAYAARPDLYRPELFGEIDGREPLRFHDCRASFITIALALGRSESWVMDRSGHKTRQMLERYKRSARSAQELNLGDWSDLDVALGLAPDPALSVEVDHGVASLGADEPHDLDLGGECPDEVAAFALGSDAEQLPEDVLLNHENSRVVQRVVQKLSSDGDVMTETPFISVAKTGLEPVRPGHGRRILNSAQGRGGVQESQKQATSETGECEKLPIGPPPAPKVVQSPVGVVQAPCPLTETQAVDLLQLCLQAKRGDLMAALSPHLDYAQQLAEAERPKVSSLESARRKRGQP